MRKFENCDIFSVLGTIVAHNTKHYQTDFDIDKDILTEAAEENSVSDRRYLWMSRPCGNTFIYMTALREGAGVCLSQATHVQG